MRKNIKRYTAILLVVAMVFPSSPVYGNMEDEYELLLESKDSEEYQKATDSNAQKNDEPNKTDPDDEDEEIYEDEDLIDDIQKASPSDAEEKDKDEVELEQNLETEKKIVSRYLSMMLFLCCRKVLLQKYWKMEKQQRQKFLCPVGIVIFIKLMKKENGQQKVNICLKRKCRMNMSWMLVQMN